MGDPGEAVRTRTPNGVKTMTGLDRKYHTLDEVLLQRAVDEDQSAVVAYPKTKHGIADYELISAATLNRWVDGAVKALLRAGLEPVYEETIAAIYGLSELDYIVNVFALGRLGYTTFILSPRLPVHAIVKLLEPVHATAFLHAPHLVGIGTQTSELLSLQLLPILTRDQFDRPDDDRPPFIRTGTDPEQENLRKCIMMHSSGSTGLPNPVDYTNRRLLATLLTAQDMIAFLPVPVFHAHGFVSFIQAIYKRKTIYMFNGNVPQTHDTLVKAIKAAKPEIVWTVPYVVKLLAEKREGIEALKRCKIVSCSGSRCPDELGDLLVSEGIHFGTAFGATEVALILESLNRPHEDKAWNYLRPPPHIAPYILMRPVDGDMCECIVLDGHRGKLKSNSDDPPNSWHTRDLFIAHPTIPNAWKFVGRVDDRVTLTNGEKVLPLPIEGRIQKEPLVKEAVVFGVDRPVPGLLLFRATSAQGLTDDQFLDKVWPAIEDANSRAEGFSQISRDMISVIPDSIDCPLTDKSSIKRAAVYREFADVIDGTYKRLENSQGGTLRLDGPELEQWIMKTFGELGITLEDPEGDFFSTGVDSLKAIQMRGLILNRLDLGGNGSKCSSLIVYDCGNAVKLAATLCAIRRGQSEDTGSNEISAMESLIEQYTTFKKRPDRGNKVPKKDVVLLTGATGSLGTHLLAQVVALPNVSKVYCPLRTNTAGQTARERLEQALKSRKLAEVSTSPKIVALSSDLSKPDLGLGSSTFAELQSEVTYIFHCAWAVNFALSVQSFAPQLASLQNVINLSLSSPFAKPARILFCSSVGTATACPLTCGRRTARIEEAPIPDLSWASPTGYARSKLIAERMVEEAAASAGADAVILRIGQIIPARSTGSPLWNPNEMIPLMVRAATTIGALPDTPGAGDSCAWIDVDTLAAAMIEIAEQKSESQLVYNLVCPRPFSWKSDFLPALQVAGLKFDVTDCKTWLEKLEKSDPDAEKNPSRKLLGFWDGSMLKGEEGRGEIVFATGKAEEKVRAIREAVRVVTEDYVGCLVDAWRTVW